VQYSTISQAQERVNHYEQRYGGFQPIRVYGHKKSFALSSGRTDYASYLTYEWEKKKIDVRTSPVPMYRVRKTVGHALHESCPEVGMKEAEADALLQLLGCYADMSLSARVAGGVRTVNVVSTSFHVVTKETWDAFWPVFRDANGLTPAEGTRDRTHNPFVAAEPHRLPDGRWQASWRGWKVLDYDADILHDQRGGFESGGQGGRRIKICYKDGVLGVAITRRTGTRQENTLRAYKSMYAE
jgi:hypothetical protein